MNIKRSLMVLVILALVFGVAGCNRSLSPSGRSATATRPAGEGAVPPASTDVMSQLELFVTQTAMAAQGGQPGAVTQPAGATTPGAPGATIPPLEVTVAPAETAAPAPTTPADTGVQPQNPTPAQPVVNVPAPTPGIPQTYTLQGGEFPFCIARRFNLNVAELLAINGLSSFSRPASGFVLRLPQNGQPFQGNRALRPHPTTYTVGAGENIHSIACLFGDVSPDMIGLANNLEPPYRVTPGMTLQIP